MAIIITGTVTFSSQANRDAALARVNAILPDFTYSNVATVFSGGVNTPNSTTITFSIDRTADGANVGAMANAILSALTQSNRHTSGWISVNIT